MRGCSGTDYSNIAVTKWDTQIRAVLEKSEGGQATMLLSCLRIPCDGFCEAAKLQRTEFVT